MSKDETTQPANRLKLSDPKTDPNPPWTGLKFTCECCGALHQLGCADELKELPSMEFENRRFEAPECWTCGHVNIVSIPRPATRDSHPVQ